MERTYEVIRSGRNSIGLEITRDLRVLIRAPRWLTDAQIAEFAEQHWPWVEKTMPRAQRRAAQEPSEQDREALTAAAQATLPPLVREYARRMQLSPAGIRITDAKTHFGSCSSKGRICFSWRLMQYPREAVEYVVVHELAHLVHRNHGPEFYALVASVLPDHLERRKLLRQ